MQNNPNIAHIASLMGDPARANMLGALMSGKALTATELSQEAGVSLQTTSSHLKQLLEGGLLSLQRQGRHKYFSLASTDVAHVLENLMCLANGIGHKKIHTGPKNPELRKARLCYNHLAGHMGITMYNSFVQQDFLKISTEGIALTTAGLCFSESFGIDVDNLQRKKSPLCKECLDWSERRYHLAGNLGRALLSQMEQIGWAKRLPNSRIIRFTKSGEVHFTATFPDRNHPMQTADK